MALPSDPYAGASRKSTVWILAVLCGFLGLGVLSLGAYTLLGKGSGRTSSILGDAGSSQSDALVKKGSESAAILPKVSDSMPTLNQPAPEQTEMPAAIRDWLEHLRRTEQRRVDLTSAQMGDLMVMLASIQGAQLGDALKEILGDENEPPAPTARDNLAEKADESRRNWQTLADFFRSVPPPAECAGIASSYGETIGETSAMMSEILDSVAQAETNPQGAIQTLIKMQGTSAGRIDSMARDTDRQVQEICDRYRTRKWFSITADVGGGMMGKLGGLGF